ncbi:MAG: ATP-dependent Clp protease ATP-binding subunit ClpC, partial [Fimbriimonadaceae bacterium]|nr:ATP-dependent Clp protease ATP-binding subunit ClpC [Fimbriimonadaceae bacterium]
GLCREGDTLAARILGDLGVGLDSLRKEVERQLSKNEGRPSQDMTLTPRAKRVIDLAYQEARNLNNDYIGTEHLLLGIVREGDGVAGRALARLGVELEHARRLVLQIQETEGRVGGEMPEISPPRRTAEPEKLMAKMLLLRQGRFRLELFALVLLYEESVADVLDKLGLNRGDVTSYLESQIVAQLVAPVTQGPLGSMAQLIELAGEEASIAGQPLAAEHFLAALIRHPDNELSRYFQGEQISLDKVRAAIRKDSTAR